VVVGIGATSMGRCALRYLRCSRRSKRISSVRLWRPGRNQIGLVEGTHATGCCCAGSLTSQLTPGNSLFSLSYYHPRFNAPSVEVYQSGGKGKSLRKWL